jgi:hypothetical protein
MEDIQLSERLLEKNDVDTQSIKNENPGKNDLFGFDPNSNNSK